MQILEQLSDRKFVVELGDFDRTREMHVVRFCSNEGLQAKSGVELHTCAIPMRQEVTIPIREVISVVSLNTSILISMILDGFDTTLKKEPK